MTERVQPLSNALPTWISRSSQEREEWLLWGLHRVSVCLPLTRRPFAVSGPSYSGRSNISQ